MQRPFGIVLIFFVLPAAAIGQSPISKPNPAFQKLNIITGQWRYTGEYKAGPLGPGAKIMGHYDYRFALNGFIVEGHTTEQSADGMMQFLEVDRYDSISKNIATDLYADDGTQYSGVITISGETATWSVKFFTGDNEYQLRQAFVVSKDGKSAQEHGEISADGKTWTPFFEAHCTRIFIRAGWTLITRSSGNLRYGLFTIAITDSSASPA
jgi:hypothetical protein